MYIDSKLTARQKLALRGLQKQLMDQTEEFCRSLNAITEQMNTTFPKAIQEATKSIKEMPLTLREGGAK